MSGLPARSYVHPVPGRFDFEMPVDIFRRHAIILQFAPNLHQTDSQNIRQARKFASNVLLARATLLEDVRPSCEHNAPETRSVAKKNCPYFLLG
jgi:hypothetical protein